jgi:hypothetical protein
LVLTLVDGDGPQRKYVPEKVDQASLATDR